MKSDVTFEPLTTQTTVKGLTGRGILHSSNFQTFMNFHHWRIYCRFIKGPRVSVFCRGSRVTDVHNKVVNVFSFHFHFPTISLL